MFGMFHDILPIKVMQFRFITACKTSDKVSKNSHEISNVKFEEQRFLLLHSLTWRQIQALTFPDNWITSKSLSLQKMLIVRFCCYFLTFHVHKPTCSADIIPCFNNKVSINPLRQQTRIIAAVFVKQSLNFSQSHNFLLYVFSQFTCNMKPLLIFVFLQIWTRPAHLMVALICPVNNKQPIKYPCLKDHPLNNDPIS